MPPALMADIASFDSIIKKKKKEYVSLSLISLEGSLFFMESVPEFHLKHFFFKSRLENYISPLNKL